MTLVMHFDMQRTGDSYCKEPYRRLPCNTAFATSSLTTTFACAVVPHSASASRATFGADVSYGRASARDSLTLRGYPSGTVPYQLEVRATSIAWRVAKQVAQARRLKHPTHNRA